MVRTEVVWRMNKARRTVHWCSYWSIIETFATGIRIWYRTVKIPIVKKVGGWLLKKKLLKIIIPFSWCLLRRFYGQMCLLCFCLFWDGLECYWRRGSLLEVSLSTYWHGGRATLEALWHWSGVGGNICFLWNMVWDITDVGDILDETKPKTARNKPTT